MCDMEAAAKDKAKGKDSRWNLRVAADDDDAVRRAAAVLRRPFTEFVRSAAVKEAEQVLADRTVFRLNEEQWARFTELLERPPQVPEGLRKLYSRPSVFE